MLRPALRIALLALLVASCAGPRVAPPPQVATPAAPQPSPPAPAKPAPAKPAWVARKVVPNAVEVAAASTTVQPGDTLAALAQRSGLPPGAVAAANRLAPGAALRPGERLQLPGGRVHVVRAGETGIAIARAYGADWKQVVAANRLAAPYTLEIGDRLLLPSKVQVAAMSVEERAAAFKINIDDLITGAEPAAPVPRRKPAAAAAAVPALPPVPAATPRFDWPLTGAVVSGFGPKPGGRYNDGINLKAGEGDPVRAAAAGVVAYAGDAVAGFGNLVLVKHADGWVSAYGHNSALLVARGDRVERGAVIARAGATGSVEEPQLHFELRRGRTAVDPLKVLPRQPAP